MISAIRPDPRLPDRWLSAARVALLLLTAAVVGLYIASVPLKLAELRQVCVSLDPDQCGLQLNLAQATQLLASGLSLEFYAAYYVWTRLALALVSWGIALAILLRRSGKGMALVTALVMVMFPTLSAGILKPLPLAYPALWLPVQLVQYTAWLSWVIFFFVFPSGRWVPRLRYSGWFVALFAAVFIAGYFFPRSEIAPQLNALGFIIFPFTFGICLLAQVYRYLRVSTTAERRQTKWVVYGVGLLLGTGLAGGIALPLLAPSVSLNSLTSPADFVADAIVNVGLGLILPVTIAISVSRHQLFDIDVIIRRTLIYAVLTALLALAYFGSVLALQSLFSALTGHQQSTLVTVLSTLAIVRLIVPLRGRVQAVIDRRFYRRKYDAAHTLAGFAADARDQVDLDALGAQLIDVVQDTMQPEQVSLWLRSNQRGVASPLAAYGQEQP
jgi:hypothetical protein